MFPFISVVISHFSVCIIVFVQYRIYVSNFNTLTLTLMFYYLYHKTCLYSFDAEPNTKVLSPSGTTQFISLSALNRLRRTDPTKVEPMWHSRYSILKSWFSDESEFSILQFVGWKGFLVSSVLLDMGKGMVLRALLSVGVFGILITLMPLLEYLITRILVSSLLWMRWKSWGKIVHAALPLKLLIAQVRYKINLSA